MNLNLSDLLTPAEVEFFSTQREEAQLRLNGDESAQVAAIRAHFADERLQLTRRVLLSVLSVSAPLPISSLESEPSAIMVTPTDALKVPVQEEAVNIPASGEAVPVLNILSETNGQIIQESTLTEILAENFTQVPPPTPAPVPTPTPPSGNILRCAGPTSDSWAVHCPKKALVSVVRKRCLSCSAKERSARVTMPKRSAVPAVVTPPVPTFDVNDAARYGQIEQGKTTYRFSKIFYLSRRDTGSRYLWDCQPSTECDPGWELIEEWRCNGLGRWESTPIEPGTAGTGNGVTKGARGYTVRELG